MERLYGQIRPYAWGSREAIARIQGRPVPSEGPEAELWLGAHATAPSSVGSGGVLPDLFATHPGLLGDGVVEEFGPRLPYLLKVLAAESPLSIQAHPDAARAEEAFAAGHPSYSDAFHKPELLVAVEEFDALCGFRDPAVSAERLEALDVAALKPVVEALRTGTVEERLRGAVSLLLSGSLPTDLVASVAAADPFAASLAEHYPDDPGVVVALLLNHVRLGEDDAVWMPAGNLHAYLCGVGVEVMAASDNVLRGGLTPKRVDVPELLRVLRFEVLVDPVVRPVAVAPGVVTWPAPVREFALYKATVAGSSVSLPGDGPRIVLCLRGSVSLGALALGAGEAAFVSAAEPPVVASGEGVVFQASTGRRI
jgi:mannose-6-phosphate isomerase